MMATSRHTFLRFSLTLLIAHCSLLICSAQPEISLLKPGTDVEGQVYYLPKTAIRLHVQVEKTTYTPGEYARYAERYLQLTDIQQEPQVSYRLISHSMSTIGVRDTSKCYLLHMKGKAETSSVVLSDDGILLAVNSMPLPSNTQESRAKSQKQKAKSQHPTSVTPILTTEILAAGSSAKKAELIARQLLEMREQRQLLVTGEADEMPQDEQQLQLMLNEIDKSDRLLMSLFTGTTVRDTSEAVITYCPDKEVERQVIFRLSRHLGIVDSDDLSGVPYYISIKSQDGNHQEGDNQEEDSQEGDSEEAPVSTDEEADTPNTLRNATLLPSGGRTPIYDKKRYSRKYKGFFVNVPTMAQITLYHDDRILDTFEKPFAQFGSLELRDGQLFKRYITHMQLDPATGAVVTFDVENDK
jgi:hypothetical protein